MGWATAHINRLRAGETVQFRPTGGSMDPLVKSGSLCTVEPIDPVQGTFIRTGDIVLCKVRSSEFLHLVKRIQLGRFLIGNNRGGTNGWIGPAEIFGRLVKTEP
jgi:hypothetical protein